MRISAPLGTFEAITEVCAAHLGSKVVDQNSIMLLPQWFLDVEQAHVTNKAEQQKAVAEIESSLKRILRTFYALHPDVRRSIEWKIRDNLREDAPVTRFQTFIDHMGESTPISTSDNFELHVRTALASFLGVPADTHRLEFESSNTKASARFAADQALSDLNMKNLTRQARDGGAWQKALTVKRCRELWLSATGNEAPKSFTGGRSGTGRFDDFLTDMIIALGKQDDWSNPAGVMNAWRERSELNEWFI